MCASERRCFGHDINDRVIRPCYLNYCIIMYSVTVHNSLYCLNQLPVLRDIDIVVFIATFIVIKAVKPAKWNIKLYIRKIYRYNTYNIMSPIKTLNRSPNNSADYRRNLYFT